MLLRRYASFFFVIPVVAFIIVLSGLIPGTSISAHAQVCGSISFPYTLPDNAPATLVTAIECANANGASADIIDLNGFTVSLLAASPYAVYQAQTGLPQITSDITLRDGTIQHDLSGGGFLFRTFDITSAGTLNLQNMILLGDSAPTPGGAFYNLGTLNVTNSTMTGYDTNNRGGVLFNGSGATANFINALLYNNNAVFAHAIDNAGSVTIVNSTFDKHNSIGQFGFILEGTGYVIRNSILWNSGSGPGQISAGNTVSDSIVKGSYSGGTNILNTDPLFVNEAGNDFRLQLTSPAINAGANAYVPTDTTDVDDDSNVSEDTPDLDLNPRIAATVVDMGAYERQDAAPPDPCLAISFPYTLPDNAPATLITAIECANDNGTADVIDLDGQTVTLTDSYADYTGATGLPQITTNMTLQNGTITRSGGNQFRLLSVGLSGNLTLNNLIATNGYGLAPGAMGGGGAIYNLGALNLVGGRFSGNYSALDGGAIHNDGGAVNARYTVFSGNSVNTSIGGVGGAVANSFGVVTLNNVLISGNLAVQGGGIYNNNSGTLTLANSTIAGNSTNDQGGGLRNENTAASVVLTNTIISGNESSLFPATSDLGGSVTNNASLVGGSPVFVAPLDASTTAPTTGGDYRLADFSPAIDAGDNSLIPGIITTDLDNNPRFYNDTGVADTGSGTAPIVDMGAYEKQTDSIVDPCLSITFPYTLPDNLAVTLITAIECANANGASADTIDLDSQIVTLTASYADYTGATGLPQITSPITLLNGTITRSGSNQFRILYMNSAANLVLDNMTLSNGSDTFDLVGGNLYNSSGILTITDSTISGGTGVYGGGLYTSLGTTNISGSIFSGNSAGYGGAIYNNFSTMMVTSSTFSLNVAQVVGFNFGHGGGIYTGGPFSISDSILENNTAQSGGGMAFCDCGGAPWTVTNTIFRGNEASGAGAILLGNTGQLSLNNVLIAGNRSVVAGAIATGVTASNTSLILNNTTVAANYATIQAGGIQLNGGTVTLNNSLVYGNEAPTNPEISGAYANNNSLVGVNPGFVSLLDASDNAPTTGGDYRLSDMSIAVDAGSNSLIPGGISTDLDGNPRRYDDTGVADTGSGTAPIIDMGAYEKQTNSPVAFPEDVDYCNLQFPTSFTAAAGGISPVIYGRIYEDDGGILTSSPGAHPSIVSQLGYGPLGSDPRGGNTAWQWFPTTYNVQVGNDDEYQATFNLPFAPTNTQLSYTYRFSVDSGANFTYCDSDGNGTNSGLGFSTANLGTLTINPGGQPSISINDVSLIEGNSGTTNFNFTISLNGPSLNAVTFDIATANNTATAAGGDYVANSQTGFVIPAGQTSTTFGVTVNGDTTFEPNETFFVNVTNVTGANVGDAQGTGTIVNDDVDPCAAYTFPYTMSGSTPAELIQAINCANANGASSDTIDLNGQTITLTASYTSAYGSGTGLPEITTAVVIQNGTITRSSADLFRFFIYSGSSSLTLNNITLSNGNPEWDGGAIWGMGSSTLIINNSLIIGNYGNYGGAIFIPSSGTAVITNTLLSGNRAASPGGAIRNRGNLTLNDSTIAANFTTAGTEGGGGIANNGGTVVLNNSIVYGNETSSFPATNDIRGTYTANNSLVGVNPSFVTLLDAGDTAPTTGGDYRLADFSVAIDAGSNSLILGGVTTDLAGNPRRYNDTGVTDTGVGTAPIVDIGAYEKQTNSVVSQADLSITKTDGVTSATPGSSVTYTITASNAGPSNASSATVADTFPAVLTGTWTCVGAGGGTCTAAGSGNISDTVNLPAGGSVTYTVSATISAAATGTLSNTATVSSSVTDPNPANNSATDTTTLTTQADLSITKTDGVTSVTPGGSVTYTITASNAGPSNASSATVADTFPAVLTGTWTCVGAGGGTCTAAGSGNINDTVNLPAGGSVTYTVSATISAAATGTLSNTATVTSGVTDPNPANNSATDTDTLITQADLSTTKTDGVTSVTPGGSVTYTITASNAGPSNAPSATVADTFPAVLTGTWTCIGAGGGTCTAAGAGNINDTVNLPAGGSVTYTVSATISPSATGTLSNTATVTSGVTDPNPANNSATDTTTLTTQADLSITKTDGVTSVTPGGSVTYTITASNAGPSNAPSATVADTFPAVLTGTWTCVGAGGGTCTAAGSGNINDTVNLPAGGSVTYTVSATISAAATGTLSNTATVVSGVTDPNPANNSATDNTTLTAPAGVTITPTTVNVTEGGASDTYSLVLDAQPSADVTVELSYGGQVLVSTNGTDFFPSPVTVTFTSANWNSPRTITVQASDDLVVEGAHNTSVDHDLTSSDPLYDGLTGESVNVEITDNDVAGVAISETSLTLNESGLTQAYTINLETVPTGQVQITVIPDGQCDIGAGPGVGTVLSLTSTAAQTITVAAVDDLLAEGPHTCTISQIITMTAALEYSTGLLASVIGNITDNDTAGVTVTPTTVSVTEGGATATYAVVLNTQPTADVTITVNGDAQASASPTSLIFTPVNWNIAQNVTVTAVEDLVAEGAHTGTISHSAAGGGYTGVSIASVIGNITDNDTAGVTVTTTTVSVTEGGATATYTVVLNTQPTADVTITMNGDAQASVTPISLIFTPVNWNIAQNVTVTAVDDLVAEGAHTGTISHSATGGGYTGVSIASVIGNITDNDMASVTVTPTTVSVTEGGATATYAVVLNTQPTADVTITVNGDAQASPSPISLIFTPANWNIAQNVTVTAVDDLVVEGAHTGTIIHTAASIDANYNGLSLASVTANITDNETDLLLNGGFEMAGGKTEKAKRWKAEAPAVTDKRICRPAIAFEGSCAYRFNFNGTIVGGGAKRAIVQKILSPVLGAGDTLDFSFYARTSNLTIAGRARVIVYYSGGKQVIKVLIPAGSSPYTLYAGSAVLTGTPTSIAVMFEPRRSTGTMFVDGVSLTATTSTRSTGTADVLPVPEAPKGFRR